MVCDANSQSACGASCALPVAPLHTSPYISLNPGMFDSSEHWSYRDLQRLAKNLDLQANGSRPALVARLQNWHRDRRNIDQTGKFLGVEVRSSLSGEPIPTRLLSPLISRSPTRRRGCMKRAIKRAPLRPRAAAVNFSPFNQVKLIPSKEFTEMFGQYQEPQWDDIASIEQQ